MGLFGFFRDPTARRRLKGPFHHAEGARFAKYRLAGGDDPSDRYASNLLLYEDGVPLFAAHQHHAAVMFGGGRYSHWKGDLFFSTSDGSDPNTNGRLYEYDHTLDFDVWERERIRRWATRWRWHPEGERFLALGGESIPPPLTANLGLTNKCNLRCEICGSQKHLDRTGVRRRHMDFATFEAVAATLFPLLAQVELNSQGDPLLHPRIEHVLARVAEHRCEVKIQHNGTLLSDSVINLLLRQTGTLMLSLDAVGPKFDEVRRGGSWAKAWPGLHRLLRERDPARLSTGVYPTLTRRTISEVEAIADWAMENGVDHISYHRYVPIQDSWEAAPDPAEEQRAIERLKAWCTRNGDPLQIQFEGEALNARPVASRRRVYADPMKAAALFESSKAMFPMEAGRPGADRVMTCAAPREYVEIGLEGQIGACCRAQDVVLGRATSVEGFARSWFGANYDAIRRSLRRGATMPYPLPNCRGCVRFFAPVEAGSREAVDYDRARDAATPALAPEQDDVFAVEEIQKEQGACYVARFPLGFGAVELELLEDDRPLGPGRTLHDEIRQLGGGRYHVGSTSLYFSTSDGTDPRRNGRSYTLRRVVPEAVGVASRVPASMGTT